MRDMPLEKIPLSINGVATTLSSDPSATLIDSLRNQLELVGTRQGCGLEQCGACRVLVDGEPAFACTLKVSECAGSEITTIESTDPILDKLRSAFMAFNAGQCGFCLSGILISALHLLRHNPSPDREDVKTALDNHLCRCGAHNRIINAVLKAAGS